MAARTTCKDLIRRLRGEIGDRVAAGSSTVPTWSDDELQDALDNRRQDVRYLELTPVETLVSGAVEWRTFYAPYGDWEEDATLWDLDGDALTPATSDYLIGKWTFAADTPLPVLLIGQSFDLHGAAADVLTKWLSLVKLDFGFSEGRTGGTFQRQQKIQMIETALKAQQAQQRITTAQMYRSDVR